MINSYIPYEHAEKAFDEIINNCKTVQEANALFKAKEAVTSQVCNFIDLQPVKYGHWEEEDTMPYDNFVVCSECGMNLSYQNYTKEEWQESFKYCPCCGAKMDGEENV